MQKGYIVNSTTSKASDFSIAYYSSDRKTGRITTVERKAGETSIKQVPVSAASGKPKEEAPVFIGLTETRQVILLDPIKKQLEVLDTFPEDAFPAHIYEDPNSACAWFMNDGDKETGNDKLNCGENGSSVSVVENIYSSDAKFLKTICVGRGHHQANFTFASERHPNVPAYGLISNLKDGTISIIGNDPAKENYLTVVKTIDLCEPDKEDNPASTVPNNSFPHGLVYSSHSGKIYNLNNGYGTVAVIDPISLEIESRFNFKGHSNLFVSPGGRYVFGRGADRKSNPDHVIAKLSVFDTETNEVIDAIDIQDVYISKYFFNPEGSRLYLTTSSSGSDAQKANLKTDAILVFDINALPSIKQVNEARLGSSSGTLDYATENGQTQLVLSSNSTDGKLVIMDIDGNELESLDVDQPNSHSRLWCI